jgi:hypothetical protein
MFGRLFSITLPLFRPAWLARNPDYTHNLGTECKRLFTTSLTTSAVSRYLGLFFHDFEHTFYVSAHALVPFEGVMILRR